jgi:hypothetical protein
MCKPSFSNIFSFLDRTLSGVSVCVNTRNAANSGILTLPGLLAAAASHETYDISNFMSRFIYSTHFKKSRRCFMISLRSQLEGCPRLSAVRMLSGFVSCLNLPF